MDDEKCPLIHWIMDSDYELQNSCKQEDNSGYDQTPTYHFSRHISRGQRQPKPATRRAGLGFRRMLDLNRKVKLH